jgi:predicted metal-binding protein
MCPTEPATPPPDLTLSICLRCRPPEWRGPDEARPGAILVERVADALAGGGARMPLTFRSIRCMSQCKRPCVAAFSGEGRFTYLFGDLDPGRDVGALLDCLALYASRPDGFMERWERPEVMRAGVLGRVPPLDSTHAFVERVERFAADAGER